MKSQAEPYYPSSMDILSLCGIVLTPPTVEAPWQAARVTIYGTERYVLGTKTMSAKLIRSEYGGYQLVFKDTVGVEFSELTNRYPVVTVHDVEVVLPGTPGLSMAKMRRGEYPAVLRDQDVLRIS